MSVHPDGIYKCTARGGVAIFVRNSSCCELYQEMDTEAEILWIRLILSTEAEILWIRLILSPSHHLFVGVVCRPDNGGVQCMGKICKSLYNINTSEVLLFGDFNARDVDWENNSALSETGNMLLKTTEDNLLVQLVNSPTHGQNILDLIFTGNLDIVDKVKVKEGLGNSDHMRIDIILKIMAL